MKTRRVVIENTKYIQELTPQHIRDMVANGTIKDQHFLIRIMAGNMGLTTHGHGFDASASQSNPTVQQHNS